MGEPCLTPVSVWASRTGALVLCKDFSLCPGPCSVGGLPPGRLRTARCGERSHDERIHCSRLIIAPRLRGRQRKTPAVIFEGANDPGLSLPAPLAPHPPTPLSRGERGKRGRPEPLVTPEKSLTERSGQLGRCARILVASLSLLLSIPGLISGSLKAFPPSPATEAVW